MSNVMNRPDQNTTTEATALVNLTALGISGAGEFIYKTGANTFANGSPSSSGGTWGSITGTLSNQIDLRTALNAKQSLNSTLTTLSALADGAGVLTNNGAGVLSWVAAGAGANTALSNLASVAINLTLVSDTDNTDALGTTAIAWSDLFLGSGGVINWNAGNVSLTHVNNVGLTLYGNLLMDSTKELGVNIINANNIGNNTDLILRPGASTGLIKLQGWGGASWVDEITIDNAGTLALGTNSIIMTGSLGATGARVLKGWFADMEITALPTINGGTLATALSLGTMASETATNYVAKSLYDANTILIATSDNTPLALTVGASTIVGRKSTGDIVALTGAEALTITGGAAVAQTFYIGTTQVAINRASAALTLAGITLTTPDIGTPSAGTLTNCTGLPAASVVAGTLTGAFTLSGTTTMNLLIPTSDHSAVGNVTNAIQSGYTASAFDLVFLGSGGKWLEVDADAVATCKGLLGIALEAKNDTQAMLVALPGSFVRDDTWNWTIGDTLYAGETPGTMQNTIPTGADAIIKVVGFAVSADVIFFNPSPDQQSVVA